MSSRSDPYEEETYRGDEHYEAVEHDRDDTDEYGYRRDRWEAGEDGSIWRFWDEGIITLLIVGGAILFLFPEPVTSGVGVLMVGFGVLLWLVDWAT